MSSRSKTGCTMDWSRMCLFAVNLLLLEKMGENYCLKHNTSTDTTDTNQFVDTLPWLT
jgi:hypothetical protein